MKDNTLFSLIRKNLLEGLSARGFPDVSVLQNYQPVQQGRESRTTVYMTKISDKRHGSPGVSAVYDPERGEIVTSERQVIESVFQMTALASPRNPADDMEYTAADVLKAAAAVIQGVNFRDALFQQGVQVLRIQDIRNTPVSNDRDQFEFQPSFDVTFTYNDIFGGSSPALSKVSSRVFRV